MKTVDVEISVEIEIHNPDVIARVLENHDDSGNPQPIGRKYGTYSLEECGWQDVFYPMYEESDVYEHLAFNYVVNNMECYQLEGWADLDSSAVSYHKVNSDCHVV